MSNQQYAYTDRDVREHISDAQAMVNSYLTWYQGDFEFLRDAKERWDAAGRDAATAFTIGQIRGVLNCMWRDMRYVSPVNLPFEPSPKPVLELVPSVPKSRFPEPVHLTSEQFRVKRDFAVNLHPSAKWFHKLLHRATGAVYYPPDWKPRPYSAHLEVPNSFRIVHLYSVCEKRLTLNWNNLELVNFEDALKVQQYCPRCAGR